MTPVRERIQQFARHEPSIEEMETARAAVQEMKKAPAQEHYLAALQRRVHNEDLPRVDHDRMEAEAELERARLVCDSELIRSAQERDGSGTAYSTDPPADPGPNESDLISGRYQSEPVRFLNEGGASDISVQANPLLLADTQDAGRPMEMRQDAESEFFEGMDDKRQGIGSQNRQYDPTILEKGFKGRSGPSYKYRAQTFASDWNKHTYLTRELKPSEMCPIFPDPSRMDEMWTYEIEPKASNKTLAYLTHLSRGYIELVVRMTSHMGETMDRFTNMSKSTEILAVIASALGPMSNCPRNQLWDTILMFASFEKTDGSQETWANGMEKEWHQKTADGQSIPTRVAIID